jgi:hypothetical protein
MNQPTLPAPNKERKLLDQYRDALRIKHYSPRTEETYTQWVKNFILYHKKRHPKEMGTLVVITCTKQRSKKPSKRLPAWQRLTNMLLLTHFAIRLLHTFYTMGTIPSTCGLGRCTHHPGTARPQRPQNHHDLHARASTRRPGSEKPS